MSTRKASVKVSILGEEYTIRTEASPEHTRAVAAHVDGIIRHLQSGQVVETQRAAILAALQITDELFHARAANEAATEAIESLAGEVRRWVPPAKRG